MTAWNMKWILVGVFAMLAITMSMLAISLSVLIKKQQEQLAKRKSTRGGIRQESTIQQHRRAPPILGPQHRHRYALSADSPRMAGDSHLEQALLYSNYPPPFFRRWTEILPQEKRWKRMFADHYDSLRSGGQTSSSSTWQIWPNAKPTAKLDASPPKTLKNDTLAFWHLHRAAELGNPHAQYWLANVLATGIPFDTTTTTTTTAHARNNSTNTLGQAIILWHMAAMEGIQEAQMTLGYRHASAYTLSQHDWGVKADCSSALAYYEEAANAAMDELELSELRGKVSPETDRHRLAEIHMHGSSSALATHNKPDELEDALEYLRIRAHHAGDSQAALTLASLHHHGMRGVSQNLTLALEFYELAANAALVQEYGQDAVDAMITSDNAEDTFQNAFMTDHPDAAGLAAKFYLLGMGKTGPITETDQLKAWRYMQMGAPGGLKACSDKTSGQKVCDAEALNAFGLAYLQGLPHLAIEVDLSRAAQYFRMAKDYGSADALYHLAMMRMGWMNSEYMGPLSENQDQDNDHDLENKLAEPLIDLPSLIFHKDDNAQITVTETTSAVATPTTTSSSSATSTTTATSATSTADLLAGTNKEFRRAMNSPRTITNIEYTRSLNDLVKVANKGHIQAMHRVGLMYARGVGTAQPNCGVALQYFRQIAEQSMAIGQRLKTAYQSSKTGNMDAALWNYLVAAEAGVELAQSNAAWLLESGYCLNMDPQTCHKASLRLWDSASKQGNAEASIRVGDYYYYEHVTTAKYYWPYLVHYLTHPATLSQAIKAKLITSIRKALTWIYSRRLMMSNKLDNSHATTTTSTSTTMSTTDPSPDSPKTLDNFELAAQYYRKAIESHSARGHFNLGYMYEWGLGVKQDFHLAKRHYDNTLIHNKDSEMAVTLALRGMYLHEWIVKTVRSLHEIIDSNAGSTTSEHFSAILEHWWLRNIDDARLRARQQVIFQHLWSAELAIVGVLIIIMIFLSVQFVRLRKSDILQ